MPVTYFFAEITDRVKHHWKEAVLEAEDMFLDSQMGNLDQMLRIKEYAQLKLIRDLVDIKGDWLSVHELQYTLDLFNACSAEVKYFEILEYGRIGVLETFRQSVSLEGVIS